MAIEKRLIKATKLTRFLIKQMLTMIMIRMKLKKPNKNHYPKQTSQILIIKIQIRLMVMIIVLINHYQLWVHLINQLKQLLQITRLIFSFVTLIRTQPVPMLIDQVVQRLKMKPNYAHFY